jgi:imidazolonepropionase-like amidohydrolase
VTSARDLGGPLEDSLAVRDAVRRGDIEGPTLYMSGPFIQKAPYPGTEPFRWGVNGVADARAKVERLAKAGVDVIKLIDQDQMTLDEARAVVDTAHARGLKVVGHSHRPEEIRRGIAIGVDNFEHTGLAAAPEYPADVIDALVERTAQMARGPLFWTPTIEGLWNYAYNRDNPEKLDDPSWRLGLKPDVIADIEASLAHPDRISYFQITPQRATTLKRKFEQLRRSGVVLLVGTDSGIPMKFHSQSTWNEIDIWTRELGVAPMDAIRAATYWPAVMQGVAKDYGTVTEGKYADIIAVRGDVLRYPMLLQRVDLVFKHGRQVR